MKGINDIKGIDMTVTVLDERKINKKVSELLRKREKIVFELDRIRLEQLNQHARLFKKIVGIDNQIEKVRKGRVIKK